MNFLTSNPVNFINTVQSPLSTAIIFCATMLGTITIILSLAFLFFHRTYTNGPLAKAKNMSDRIHDFFVVAISSCGAYLVAHLLQNLLKIPRPFVKNLNLHPLITQSGYGFPSEHATTFMALGIALFFLHRRVGIFFIIIALIIGIARVFAGVHTPLDVLAGFVLGMLGSYIVAYIDRKVCMKSKAQS